MKPDSHTPCPVCPVVIRSLYAAAQVVLALQESPEDTTTWARGLDDALEQLRLALEHVAPFVDAHLSNQDHAHSVELAGARMPEVRS
jgi:hypothetical protein